jgi:hypothetical protein
MDNAPAPVSRGALERVLARASELQSAAGDAPESEAMTEAQVVELAKEVGLSPEHVRQALAEERARGEPEVSDSIVLKLLGERRVSAQRVVPGNPDDVIAALDRWMQNEEWLRVKRQQRDRMVWEPRRDLMAGLRRAFAGRPHVLHAATDVAATVVSVDGGKSLVAITADLATRRAGLMGGAASGVVIGAAASGALALMGFMSLIAVVPVIVLAPISIYAAQRAMAAMLERTHIAIEQVLDQLERRSVDPRPPSLLQRVIDSALPPLR